MNLSLSVLRHLIKGKARCNNTNRYTQWYDDLCAERHVVLGVFESRQNVKYNFDIFKIVFSRYRLSPLEIFEPQWVQISCAKSSRRILETDFRI